MSSISFEFVRLIDRHYHLRRNLHVHQSRVIINHVDDFEFRMQCSVLRIEGGYFLK